MPAIGAVWDRVSTPQERIGDVRLRQGCRAYHDQDVTLPKSEQDAMRDRRNSNRTRLKNGLAKAEKPAPIEFVKQG
jgi:hypothetical protein